MYVSMAVAVRTLVRLQNVIASIFCSVCSSAYSLVAFIVEHGEKVLRETFKAIMIEQFVTPRVQFTDTRVLLFSYGRTI